MGDQLMHSPLANRHLEQLLRDVCDTLDEAGVPYAIIGGIALSIWGEPRTTFDIDFVVTVRPDEIDSLCRAFRESTRFPFESSVCPMPRMTLVRVHQVDHDETRSGLLLADLLVPEDDTHRMSSPGDAKVTFSVATIGSVRRKTSLCSSSSRAVHATRRMPSLSSPKCRKNSITLTSNSERPPLEKQQRGTR